MLTFNRGLIIFFLFFLISNCQQQQMEDTTSVESGKNEGVLAKNGMVVTAHPLASQVGLAILKKGGNAFDAAIAVQYALAVVLPKAGNIGGGGFMVYRTKDGENGALDFREKAPLKGDRDMYLDKKGEPIKNLSLKGHLAAGVPGTVAGMDAAFQKFASLPFSEIIQPSIDLAQNGFELTEYEADLLNRFQEDFKAINLHTPYLVREEEYQEGDSIYHTDLAKTLERIRDNGKDGFYKGETADLIVKEMKAGKGIISLEDLASYEAKWRKPIIVNYRGHKVISMPPSSSGGLVLGQLLKGSEYFDFPSFGVNTTKSIHVMTELQRRAYADRAEHMGDMDFYEVPIDMLLEDSYIKNRISDITMDSATSSQVIKSGKVNTIESFQTTHFSIVDKEGNAVAITTTLNSYFGCKVMVDGAGFFLNNEMDDFSIKPGVPNQFGLVGAEANAIAPGKRMLSAMTPTIIEKEGKLFMVVGTPGGSTIITNVYQVILNVIDHGLTMQEAVDAKKMHSQWLPDRIIAEKGCLDSLTIDALQHLGHEIKEINTIGRIEAILVKEDGTYEGAADKTRSGDAMALGY
ncbi:gamma-glutamyltransferase [Flexithrix dorotheae]|uniref:gamma-glutamyltransferase n=1 Tax=Flexithrix dorotheae TaxID=70993 RepID=UPI00037B2A55|nr:gamma-glutamyltransferase [Flexithrix dorotheae]